MFFFFYSLEYPPSLAFLKLISYISLIVIITLHFIHLLLLLASYHFFINGFALFLKVIIVFFLVYKFNYNFAEHFVPFFLISLLY